MNVESLEINILKASEVKDDDIVIIKIQENDKLKFTKETIQELYKQIKLMLKKENIPIYFFPKNIDINIIKNHVIQVESNKEKIDEIADKYKDEN